MVDFGGGKKPSHGGRSAPPFAEIVGQEELKEALLAVATNDDLDGLLVRGEKGTAKSTAVRALADLLPEQPVVADCPYGCPPDEAHEQCETCRERTDPPTAERPVPLVTLPLGATRERVVGTLSVADALEGDPEFDPGLLARANRGILYVDEVNLLDDHLVDVLLDAAASGVNRVERDGVSVSHPAEFTLVGTMNPEEGDLRPQLRDRFALQTTVTACEDLDRRVAIIDRSLEGTGVAGSRPSAADESTSGDSRDDETADDVRDRLLAARERLGEVDLSSNLASEIASLCRDAGVDGHRGDIATARAARTLAALDGRSSVREDDVRRAAELALPHRLRSRPFEETPDPDDLIDEHFDDSRPEGAQEDGEDGSDRGETDADGDASRQPDGPEASDGSGQPDGTEAGDGSGQPDGTEAGDASPADGTDADSADDPGDGEDGRTDGPAPRPRAGAEGDAGTADGTGEPPTPDGQREDGDESAGAATPEGSGTGEDAGAAGAGKHGESGRDGAAPDSDDATDETPLLPGQSRAGLGTAGAPDLPTFDGIDGESGDSGGRARTRSDGDADGARVRSQRTSSPERVDAAASVRAAAARGASAVESRDLRRSVRRSDAGALVVFAVDASASMVPAMRAAKGTVLELLKDAYQQRDEVAFVAFAGETADVLLPPTDSVSLAARHLKDLPTGDRTPLPAGLRTAADVLDRADPAAGVVVLVTDGRANVADGSPVGETRAAARRLRERESRVLVVDADDGSRSGVMDVVVAETDAERVSLGALSAERIDAAVGAATNR